VRFKNLQAQWAARNADDLAILIWVSIESAHRKSAIRTQVLHIYARIEEVLTAIMGSALRNAYPLHGRHSRGPISARSPAPPLASARAASRPAGRHVVVQGIDIGHAATQHYHVRIEQVDDAGQRARQPIGVLGHDASRARLTRR
jgi:hypothetical protein